MITEHGTREEVATAAKLEEVADWGFLATSTGGVTHSFHPWAAKFIPQIPRTLIRALTEPGDTVFDPFAGCGTTLVEAVVAGRNALGNDVNPLAALLSRVKTRCLSPAQVDAVLNALETAGQLVRSGAAAPHNAIPDAPNFDYWFEPEVVTELAHIRSIAVRENDEAVSEFLFVAMSAIVVGVSNQDSETRYKRTDKNIAPGITFERFGKKIGQMLTGVTVLASAGVGSPAVVTNEDAQALPSYECESVDAAIFSPPYLNAYDYHLYHRWRLFWLGMDPRPLRKTEIGAHLKYEPDEQIYMVEMGNCIGRLYKILRPGGSMAIVIGDSLVQGKLIDNASLLVDVASQAGFRLTFHVERSIPSNRKVFNAAFARLKSESILVFTR
jgi:hypothetical protein